MPSVDDAKRGVYQFLVAIGRDAGFDPARVGELLGTPSPDESPNVGPVWTFRSTFGTFWVSQRTGEVAVYLAPDSTGGGAPVPADAAEGIARAFVTAVYPAFGRRAFQLVQRQDADDGFGFEFEEAPVAPETSIFPNFISVWVDAELGRVTRYTSSNLDFRRHTPPRIGEAEARRIIEGMVKEDGGTIERIWLHEEALDGATRSVTVWSAAVVFSGGPFVSADRIAIDADTGERVELP